MNKDLDDLIKEFDSYYGILITKNNKIIYEKYNNNNKNTRFRIFSLTKPITGLAILLLVQMNKLKLNDTLNKFYINIPYNDKITINHLLYHSSGIYDFSSELYFNLKHNNFLEINGNKTKLIDFNIVINEINHSKSYYKPNIDYHKNYKYNNTGYDILGYIIYLVSGLRTDEFIIKNIFNKLNMINCGFQHNEHTKESIPYVTNIKVGIKEQQNWYCCNGNIVCSLRDYNKFLYNYDKLLDKKYLKKYHKLYYSDKIIKNNNKYKWFGHEGAGDFSNEHINKKIIYKPLSMSRAVKFFNKKDIITIIVSENYIGKNGFSTNNWFNYDNLINNMIYY